MSYQRGGGGGRGQAAPLRPPPSRAGLQPAAVPSPLPRARPGRWFASRGAGRKMLQTDRDLPVERSRETVLTDFWLTGSAPPRCCGQSAAFFRLRHLRREPEVVHLLPVAPGRLPRRRQEAVRLLPEVPAFRCTWARISGPAPPQVFSYGARLYYNPIL